MAFVVVSLSRVFQLQAVAAFALVFAATALEAAVEAVDENDGTNDYCEDTTTRCLDSLLLVQCCSAVATC